MDHVMIEEKPAELALRNLIKKFVSESPMNRLVEIDGAPIFDAPLVGVADGDDPLFEEYKSIIGAFHLTPREALALDSSPDQAPPTRLSVICWVLPITQITRESNRSQKLAPSKRWIHTREHGERFNDALRDQVVAWLKGHGYRAVAPARTDQFQVYRDERALRPPASNWSERHIQYAAGLGTFSINDGMITPAGIAMRCGSVVTDLPLQPTERGDTGPFDYCLYLAQGTCGVCMQRCPAGAITSQGHDKAKCNAYMRDNLRYLHYMYPDYTTGCGLCQTGVPCEQRIPSPGSVTS